MEDEVEIKIEYYDIFEQDPLSLSSNLQEDATLSEIHEGSRDVEDSSSNEDITKHKPEGITEEIEEQHTPIWYKSMESKGRYECKFCSLVYSTIQSVRRHTLFKHPAEASVIKSKIAKLHRSINKCHICKRNFQTLAELKNHLKTIHPNTNNQCLKCQAMFDDENSLFIHLQTIHNLHNTIVHMCLACGYKTTKISHYHQHEKIHLQYKTHKCDYCNYATNNMTNLRIHERIHEKTYKPYKCKVLGCSYSSTTSSALATHVLIHNKESHFIYCDKCTYKTVYKQSLKKHIESHGRNTVKIIL